MLLDKRLNVGELANESGIISLANVPQVDDAVCCMLLIGIGIINLAIDSSSQHEFLLLHVSEVLGTFLFTIFEVSGKGGCNLRERGVVGSVVCFWVDAVCCTVGGDAFWVEGVRRGVVTLSVIGSNGGKSSFVLGTSGVIDGGVTGGTLCVGSVTKAGRLTGNFGVNSEFLPSSGNADSIPLQPSGKK